MRIESEEREEIEIMRKRERERNKETTKHKHVAVHYSSVIHLLFVCYSFLHSFVVNHHVQQYVTYGH